MFPRVVTALAVFAAGAASAAAQVPGAPTLQNAFANPGLAFAADFGSGAGSSFFGAAGAWGLGSGKIQVSGVAGAERSQTTTRGAYGARAAMSLWSSSGGSLGAGVFAGIGGGPRSRDSLGVIRNPARMNVPVGVSLGYRRPFGSSRGVSAYASPMYRWSRVDAGTGGITSTGAFRVAAGVDFAVSQSFGVTGGAELGGADAASNSSAVFGFAVTFVPGRR